MSASRTLAVERSLVTAAVAAIVAAGVPLSFVTKSLATRARLPALFPIKTTAVAVVVVTVVQTLVASSFSRRWTIEMKPSAFHIRYRDCHARIELFHQIPLRSVNVPSHQETKQPT